MLQEPVAKVVEPICFAYYCSLYFREANGRSTVGLHKLLNRWKLLKKPSAIQIQHVLANFADHYK